MPSFNLTKTPQGIEQEEAQKRRELELDVQKRNRERDEKIAAYYKKEKRTKIIVVAIIIGVFLLFAIPTIYNTFFKREIQKEEILQEVYTSLNTLWYPSEGLDNYIRDNAPAMIMKCLTSNNEIIIDQDSCRIVRVKKLSTYNAQVFFAINITTKVKDTKITDETTINQLIEKGLTADSAVTLKINDRDYTYFIKDETVYQQGNQTTERYVFHVFVLIDSKYDNGEVVANGFALGSNAELYSLVDVDQTDFEEFKRSAYLEFYDNTQVDSNTASRMQLKVTKILEDLYSKRDTSQDFFNYREFNTYDASFAGIEEFDAHTYPNPLGYNVRVVYNIITPQGFKYAIEAYFYVEQNGNSFIITKML